MPLTTSKPTGVRSLSDLPPEVVTRVLQRLRLCDVGAMVVASRTAAELVRSDRLWRRFYLRDFARKAAPHYHYDHARHGRGFRWLYALALTEKRAQPLYFGAGVYLRVTLSPNGRERCSGEWVPMAQDAHDPGRLVMSGYGATVVEPAPEKKTARRLVQEGIWRRGVFVGPGRACDDNGYEYHCARFSSGKAYGEGTVTDYGGYTYTGELVAGRREGFGQAAWSSRNRYIGEWTADQRNGRGTFYDHADGWVRSGQSAASVLRGLAVVRQASGILSEGTWTTAKARAGYKIDRRGSASVLACPSRVTRGAKPTGTMVYVHDDAVCMQDGDVARVDSTVSGDMIVNTPDRIVLAAIGDSCTKDVRLAGRRIFGLAWSRKDGRAFCLPADLESPETRLLAAYLESPCCMVPPKVASAYMRELVERAKKASVSIEWRPGSDDRDAIELGLGLPFGRVLPPRPSSTQPEVRCFLTGAVVPAAVCALVASGSLYVTERILAWMDQANPNGMRDPETGDELGRPPGHMLHWRSWMADVPPDVLVQAARAVFARCSAVDKGALDSLRFAVASMSGALAIRRRDVNPWEVVAAGEPLSVSVADACAPLLGGFDGMRLTCVELRHPSWDPRGPWSLGKPVVAPDDPTLDDFELALASAEESAPTAFLRSHGVVHIVLGAASFVGAQLSDVYFFGQVLDETSFVGASLGRCVFVGCGFRNVAFADAVLTECAFYTCRNIDDGAYMTNDYILARIRDTRRL